MEPAWHFATPGSRPGAPGPAALRPGQTFGPYQLVDELGAGGMGAVYRARDGAGREVALKVIRGQLNERRRARFKREGELTSRLRHPGIVQVLGGGEIQGLPFLVYDLVEGARELSQAFRDASLERRVELLRDAAAAVGHAHAEGVIHRDLKPENILIDQHGRVRVADFGLAKGDQSEALTQTGAVLGTLGYMSPEQLVGKAADARSDVWALGVILYEALCGGLPFELGSPTEIQARVVGQTPKPPSTVDARIPTDLSRVCLRALAKDPDTRYADAGELSAVLSAWLSGQQVELQPRSRLAPALLVCSGLLALLAAVAWVARPAGSPATASETPVRAAPPSPVGSPRASSRATADDLEDLQAQREAEQRWARIQTEPGSGKLLAAWRWLVAYPDHPRADEARDYLAALRATRPLLQLDGREVGSNARVGFLPGEDSVVVYARAVIGYGLDGSQLWRRWDGTFTHRVFVLRNGDWLFSNNGRPTRLRGDALPTRWRKLDGQRHMALDPQERWVACVGSRGPVRVFRVSDGKLLHKLDDGSELLPRELLATRDGRLVCTRAGSPDAPSDFNPGEGWAWIYDPLDGKVLASRRDLPPLNSGALAEDPVRDELALGTSTGSLLILDSFTLAERRRFSDASQDRGFMRGAAHPGAVGGVVYTANGDHLLTAAGYGVLPEQRVLKRWDVQRGVLVGEARPLGKLVFRLSLSPSGRLLGIGYGSGEVEVWIEALP